MCEKTHFKKNSGLEIFDHLDDEILYRAYQTLRSKIDKRFTICPDCRKKSFSKKDLICFACGYTEKEQ